MVGVAASRSRSVISVSGDKRSRVLQLAWIWARVVEIPDLRGFQKPFRSCQNHTGDIRQRGICVSILSFISINALLAQEDQMIIANEDVFGKLERSAVAFPHDLHMEVFAEDECGVCHHSYDETAGSLTYEPGDEISCKECHLLKKDGRTPALREAYHGSCTVCHRNTIKKSGGKSGPTTCGECHVKTSD